ncbi:MAG: insertase [Flavobacteriaceae bacterium]|nr:insertase [Flavobacteriaceae bacterium]|tara:strand:+ start:17 stop:1567 length:1551 start_codon:yes stop_codon:yes gene_type:complete
MNWRYFYIGSIVAFSYVLFLSWNAEKEIKQEFVEASLIKQNQNEKILPQGETLGFIEIQNSKLVVQISPSSGKIWQARLKEHTYLNNNNSQGVRLFGFDLLSGFKFYLNSGFVEEVKNFEVLEVGPDTAKLISIDGRISKTISLKENDYELFIEDRWVGEIPADIPTPYIAMYRTDGKPLDARDNFFENSSYTGVAFNTPAEPYANTRLRSIGDGVEYFQRGGWVAFIQKYFMAAILTPSDRVQTLTALPPSNGSDTYVMGAISRETKASQLVSGIQHRVFVGPKIRSDLISRAPDLELTIDMGWFWFLAQPLMMMLSMINVFVGNWGVSIILLTVLIKFLLWPVSAKGFSSMAKMRTVGPKLKEIQERYKDDRAKLGTEMMALYKKEGINPAGGCFPLLLQMPVFIAFFFCLRESVELRHESFFFWVQDLSAPDPFFILPVIFAALMYLTQQLNPQPPGMDPTQAQIMKFMPVMIAAIFVIMPAGLVLYSVANSAISLIQQKAMYKKYGAPSAPA